MHTDDRTTRRGAETDKGSQSFSERPPLRRSRVPLLSNPMAADSALSLGSPGGGEGPKPWRRVAILAAGVGLALSLTACTGDKSDPMPEPSPAPSTTATSTAPSWEAQYSVEELDAYNTAVARLKTYEQESAPLWKAGVVTPAAKKVFQKYFTLWQSPLADLELYEKNKLSRTGALAILSSEATRIKLSGQGGSLTIRQCTDPSGISISQGGKEIAPENNGPQFRDVTFDRVDGKWFLFQIAESKGDQPCVG
jgi:hypothetical protein